jgi:hypothetical protein
MKTADVARVMNINLATLETLGIDDVVCGTCPDCGMAAVTAAEHRSAVCGYCGGGPFTIAEVAANAP